MGSSRFSKSEGLVAAIFLAIKSSANIFHWFWLYLKGMLFECTKNEVFKYSERMPCNMEKVLNVKDKYISYFYKESQRF